MQIWCRADEFTKCCSKKKAKCSVFFFSSQSEVPSLEQSQAHCTCHISCHDWGSLQCLQALGASLPVLLGQNSRLGELLKLLRSSPHGLGTYAALISCLESEFRKLFCPLVQIGATAGNLYCQRLWQKLEDRLPRPASNSKRQTISDIKSLKGLRGS